MPIRHAEWRVRSSSVIKLSSYTQTVPQGLARARKRHHEGLGSWHDMSGVSDEQHTSQMSTSDQMSALARFADSSRTLRTGRKVPISDIALFIRYGVGAGGTAHALAITIYRLRARAPSR